MKTRDALLSPQAELQLLLRPAGGGTYLVSTGKAEQQAFQRRYYGADTDDDVTEAFATTLAQVATARVAILGVPSDVGAGFRRGASQGPQALRAAMLERGLPWADAASGVIDVGDVFVVPQFLDDEMLAPAQLARARAALYPDVEAQVAARMPVSPLSIAERALMLLWRINPRIRPLVLGGDHSVAWPVAASLVAARPELVGKLAILQFDAHTDLLPERLGVRICFGTWSHHANLLLGRQGRLVQVGIRASRHDKAHWHNTEGVAQFWPQDIDGREDAACEEIIAALRASGATSVYISNDIDGTDEQFADATGTPEPGGLSPAFVERVIRAVGRTFEVVATDLVEVAPGLGHDGSKATLDTAARYLTASLHAMLPS